MLALFAVMTLVVGLAPLAFRAHRDGISRATVLDLWPAAAGVFFGGTTLMALVSKASTLVSAGQQFGDEFLLMGMLPLASYVVVASGVSLIMARRSRRPFLASLTSASRRINPAIAIVLVVAVWSVRVHLAQHYGIHYSGTATPDRILGLPYETAILRSLSMTVSVVLPVWALIALRSRRNLLVASVAVVVLAAELLYGFFSGRREFAFLLLLLVWVLQSLDSGKTFRNAALTLCSIAFIVVAFPTFESARHVASRDLQPGSSDLIEFAQSIQIPATNQEQLAPLRYEERAAMYILWSAEVAEAQRRHHLLQGAVLAKGLAFTVPTVIVPEKRSWDWGEELVNSHYEIPRGDSPNSVAMAGLADFGLSGVLVYALAFGVILLGAELLGGRLESRLPLVGSLLLLVTLRAAVLVEQTIVELGVEARNVILLSSIVLIYHLLRSHRFRGRHLDR